MAGIFLLVSSISILLYSRDFETIGASFLLSILGLIPIVASTVVQCWKNNKIYSTVTYALPSLAWIGYLIVTIIVNPNSEGHDMSKLLLEISLPALIITYLYLLWTRTEEAV